MFNSKKKDNANHGYFCKECGHKKCLYFLIGDRFCLYCMKSTVNDINIFVSDSIIVRDSFKLRKKSSGFRKFAVEVIGGWFHSHRYKDGVELSRSLDKEKDEYNEVVKDYKTGKIIHESHGKLSEHIGHVGHGNAKQYPRYRLWNFIKQYGRVIFVFSIPAIIILSLIGSPLDTKLVEISMPSRIISLPPDDILEPSLLTALSDALQIQLHIKNFEIYFKNYSEYSKDTYYGIDEDLKNCDRLPNTGLKVQGSINGNDFNTQVINVNEKSYPITYKRGESIQVKQQEFISYGDSGGCVDILKGGMYLHKNMYEWFGKALFIIIFWILFLPALLDINSFLRTKLPS